MAIENKTKQVNIRLTEAQYFALKEKAVETGARNMSSFVLDVLKRELKADLPVKKDVNDFYELYKNIEKELQSVKIRLGQIDGKLR